MMEQIIELQPKLLNSYCNLLSNYFCKFSKTSVACNCNWKVLKANKSTEKKINIKPIFDMMEQKIDPNLGI